MFKRHLWKSTFRSMVSIAWQPSITLASGIAGPSILQQQRGITMLRSFSNCTVGSEPRAW